MTYMQQQMALELRRCKRAWTEVWFLARYALGLCLLWAALRILPKTEGTRRPLIRTLYEMRDRWMERERRWS